MTAKAIPDPEMEDSVTTNDSTDEYTYRCPHCDASYADERLVRVHITRSDDPTHRHRNGLMPEEKIEVVDDNGQIVATRSKRPEDVDLSEVSMRDFPTDLTTKRKHALVVATRHPEIDNRRELTTMVNERLADDSWETSPPSHQTVRRALDEFYHPHEDETTAVATDDETLDVLTPIQQAILIGKLALPDEANTRLADRVGCASSYPSQLVERKSHVFAGLKTRIEQGDDVETILADELSSKSLTTLVQEDLLSNLPIDADTVASDLCDGDTLTHGTETNASDAKSNEPQWGSPIDNANKMSAGPDDSILASAIENSTESNGSSETLAVSDSSGTSSSTPSDGCDEVTDSMIDENDTDGSEIATAETETVSTSGETEIVADIETLRAKVAFFRQTLDPVDDRNGETALVESFAKQVEQHCERMLQHEGNA